MKSTFAPILEVLNTTVFILVVAFIFRFFLFQPFVVDGQSMEPNFQNQEYIIIDKLTYRLTHPKRGEVVVFEAPVQPGSDYIKRIVGLPGETVRVSDNKIYINGKILEEDYLPATEKTLIGNDPKFILERTLGDNEYFVLGDNREHSSDSREWGVLPGKNIVGRAWLAVFPTSFFGVVSRPSYNF